MILDHLNQIYVAASSSRVLNAEYDHICSSLDSAKLDVCVVCVVFNQSHNLCM